ncbi:hypothetical protein [Hydrogenophaga sp. BPS33]|uniref:hypothetical protein n=1 Tax=Hydrogenophaga sp. BPS33 TaxID=2651974 RepID=UPI0013583406|nr:hypothetical protein [Hydrogenophaga sp. BPS33]
MKSDLTTRALLMPLQPHVAFDTQGRCEDISIPDTPPDPAPIACFKSPHRTS